MSSDRSNACQFYYPPPLTSFNANNNTNTNSTNNTSTLSGSVPQNQNQLKSNNMYSNTLSDSQVDEMHHTTLTLSENPNSNNNNNNVINNYNPPSNSILSQSQLSYSSNVQKCQNYIMPSNYNNSGKISS